MKRTQKPIFILAIIAGGLLTTKIWPAIKYSSVPNQAIQPPPTPANQTDPEISLKFTTISINQTKLKVELARTPEEIIKGLSNREEIGADGMLFVFNSPSQRTFWMKDMKFPIDLLWITNGQIVGIETNLPVPDQNMSDDQLQLFNSPELVSHVLELPAGASDRLGIKIGDQILTTDPDL